MRDKILLHLSKTELFMIISCLEKCADDNSDMYLKSLSMELEQIKILEYGKPPERTRLHTNI